MTPVETLREAARLMREGASTATESPWRRWTDLDDNPSMQGFLMVGDAAAEGEECNPIAHVYIEPDAEHIASWHPGVALAVADWLDVTARDVGTSSTAYHAALVVARAYLEVIL